MRQFNKKDNWQGYFDRLEPLMEQLDISGKLSVSKDVSLNQNLNIAGDMICHSSIITTKLIASNIDLSLQNLEQMSLVLI